MQEIAKWPLHCWGRDDVLRATPTDAFFPFPFLIYRKIPITILVYWRDVIQQINFSLSHLIYEWPESSHACGFYG